MQSRYFNAAGEPDPLSCAKRKAKLTGTVEAESEVPWHPKSVLAFLDCLESIKFAWILVEMASERAVVAYCDWFARQVRSRPAKIDQLRVYWESASWRLAFELRAKNSFQRITEEIMGDTQALQDALNREVQPERPRKRTNKTDYQVQSFKGKGAGSRPAGKGGEDRRWRPYDSSGNSGYRESWGSWWQPNQHHRQSQWSNELPPAASSAAAAAAAAAAASAVGQV